MKFATVNSTKVNRIVPSNVCNSLVPCKQSYSSPLAVSDLERMSRKTFAPDTMKKINWVVNMYDEWRKYRNGLGSLEYIVCDLHDVGNITKFNLCFALTRFVTEVRKLDGELFPGKTLYEIIVSVQMYLETQGFNWKLIDDKEFTDLKFTLDNVMKSNTSAGIGISVRQADVLTFSDEDYLWRNGFLGKTNPQQLLDTVVFLLGMSCALRAGKEHRALCSMGFNSQISWHMDRDGNRYFTYREDIGLKTNKGGLKHRKVFPKVVNVYPIADSSRCPVRILYCYFCKLPINRTCSALYLHPRSNFNGDKWYTYQPVGVNKLQSVVKTVCKNAGLKGFYANHSLRSTAATRMYQNDCPEQIIQEVTGHRSLAVRSYKCTSELQKQQASASIFTDMYCHEPKFPRRDDYCDGGDGFQFSGPNTCAF